MNLAKLSHRLIRIAVIGVFTLVFMMVSRPSDIPAVFLIVPFVSIFGFLYLAIIEIVRFLGPDEDENGAIVYVRRPRLISATVAGFPVLLLVLQSIVELTIWDVLIAFTILLLAYIYISRSSISLWR
jgi:RsiW-degrading membrane proteinase PrsW (M82 family)